MKTMPTFGPFGDRFKNRVVLITGATSGIGRATALAFSREGANVAVGDIREVPVGGEPSTGEIIGSEGGGRALFVKADVSDRTQVFELVRQVMEEFGRVDILVNNAGLGHTSLAEHIPDEVLRRVVGVNFYGVVYGVQAVLPIMRAQGSGHIINISSGAAMLGLPYASIYAATKAAIMRFSEALRYELEESNIRVSVIFPDFTATDLALEVTPAANMPTKTVRPLSQQGVREYGAHRARLQSADEVAKAVLSCALRPRSEVYLSARIRFNGLIRCLLPAAVEHEARQLRRLFRHFLERVGSEEDKAQKTAAPEN